MENNKISICVPVYEMNGSGSLYLFHLLKSIKKQTYTNYEVVISDHSKDNEIEENVSKITSMDIKYIRYEENRGNSSCNINNAIKHSTGSIIKPMFQDDVIVSDDLLTKINDAYEKNPDVMWGGVGFIHIDKNGDVKPENPAMIPRLNPNIVTGVNTFGCPSVCFFKKNDELLFDEKLVWLMDCEFYHRISLSCGSPYIINSYDVAVRIWDSFTGEVSDEIKQSEEIHVKKKYNIWHEKDSNNNGISGEQGVTSEPISGS